MAFTVAKGYPSLWLVVWSLAPPRLRQRHELCPYRPFIFKGRGTRTSHETLECWEISASEYSFSGVSFLHQCLYSCGIQCYFIFLWSSYIPGESLTHGIIICSASSQRKPLWTATRLSPADLPLQCQRAQGLARNRATLSAALLMMRCSEGTWHGLPPSCEGSASPEPGDSLQNQLALRSPGPGQRSLPPSFGWFIKWLLEDIVSSVLRI